MFSKIFFVVFTGKHDKDHKKSLSLPDSNPVRISMVNNVPGIISNPSFADNRRSEINCESVGESVNFSPGEIHCPNDEPIMYATLKIKTCRERK